METRVIQNLIESYFNLIKKQITDMVPKTIMAFLVEESQMIAHSELVAQIYKSEAMIESLLEEDPMVVAQREGCREMVMALRAARDLIEETGAFKM